MTKRYYVIVNSGWNRDIRRFTCVDVVAYFKTGEEAEEFAATIHGRYYPVALPTDEGRYERLIQEIRE